MNSTSKDIDVSRLIKDCNSIYEASYWTCDRKVDEKK